MHVLTKQIEELYYPDIVAYFSNVSALLYECLEDVNWVGFYFVKKDRLVLGPFQGKVACVEIAPGKGVCGKSLKEDRVILVENVHEFEGHIACDSASNSEIVLPVHKDNKVYALLDIDSPLLSRFKEEDRKLFIEVVEKIEEKIQAI